MPESTEADLVLEIRNLSVQTPQQPVFQGLNLQLYQGEVWALCGPSGSGKSLFLEALLGRVPSSGGEIRRVFCDRFRQLHPIRDPYFSCHSLMALVTFRHRFTNRAHQSDGYHQQRFQAGDAGDVPTLKEYLSEIQDSLHLDLSPERWTFQPDWVLETLHLKSLLDRELIQLSNGETRRCLLAAALLRQPRLLLLDNVFSGLDAGMRVEMGRILAEVAQQDCQVILVAEPRDFPDAVTHVLEFLPGKSPRAWSRDAFEARVMPTAAGLPEALPVELPESLPGPSFQQILRMRDVRIQYGDTLILQDIDWDIRPGEAWALLGENGAGKSTLLSLIAGDNPQAYAQNIWLFDRKRGSGESIWDIKRNLGYLSPEIHQYFRSSASLEEVVLRGLSDQYRPMKSFTLKDMNQARRWLELLGLGAKRSQPFDRSSSSEQRLCLLGRALIRQPALLILDEPFQGLDGSQKSRALALLERWISERRQTLIYVSHYQDELPGNLTHHLWLRGGRIYRKAAGHPFQGASNPGQ